MTKKRETKKVQLAQYSLERVNYIIEFLDFAHPTITAKIDSQFTVIGCVTRAIVIWQ